MASAILLIMDEEQLPVLLVACRHDVGIARIDPQSMLHQSLPVQLCSKPMTLIKQSVWDWLKDHAELWLSCMLQACRWGPARRWRDLPMTLQ